MKISNSILLGLDLNPTELLTKFKRNFSNFGAVETL
jgi:hypothetical protein